MTRTIRSPRSAPWVALAVVASLGLGAALWLGREAEAQLGGHAQVVRLELRYTPGDRVLDARFHMASGPVVDESYGDDESIDRLLQTAEILASGKARLFATVESGRIRSWHLSVP